MAPAVADLKAMTDAFEGIDKLAEGAPRTDGAPNFRRVNTNRNTKTQKQIQIQIKKVGAPRTDGAPNFRRVITTFMNFTSTLDTGSWPNTTTLIWLK